MTLRQSSRIQLPLRIAAQGMCCAVGHHAKAASAAIRARMNHFRETEFISNDGQPLIGSMLYGVEHWGAVRLNALFDSVFHESLSTFEDVANEQIAILLLLPEAERPGAPTDWVDFAAPNGPFLPGSGYHAESRTLKLGKAGISSAIQLAQRLFTEIATPPRLVALVAVDSFFTSTTIAHYLKAKRLKTADNPDGFTPAEAAAAVVLTPRPAPSPALWIDGVASANEPAPLGSDNPCLAEGLSQAIRGAAQAAQCEIASLAFHASGISGESWYFREGSLALTRTMEQRVEHFPHELVARSVGETGAVAPVLTLAWLADAMGRAHGPGRGALLHFSNDNPLRSALVVHYRN
jgi:3-oxoacyl-[acyl-carrier-protein] synthase I